MAASNRREPAGAMTTAMRAVATSDGPRVLRIGVAISARVVEERIVLDRGAVTVGTNERCTFVVHAPDAPARFELFARIGDGYALCFTGAMAGRVALADGVRSLEELRTSGRAHRTGAVWQLALAETARGKITLGDATLLFQFVAPPPVMPRPQLPVAIRARALSSVDGVYSACLAGLFALSFGVLGYVEYGYDPEVALDEFALEATRTVDRLLPPPPSVTEPATPGAIAEPAPTPVAAAPADTAHPPVRTAVSPAGTHAPANDARHLTDAVAMANRAADIAARAFAHDASFQAIATALSGRDSAQTRVNDGGLMAGEVEGLRNVRGIAAHATALQRGRDTLLASNTPGNSLFGHGHTVAPTGPELGTAVTLVARAPAGRVELAAAPETRGGDISIEDVGAVIRRNIGGVQACYNGGLRMHPTLAGRVEVRFTIGTNGRVSAPPVVHGFDDAPEVAQCVANRLRALAYPPPSDGAVTVSFPFGFSHP